MQLLLAESRLDIDGPLWDNNRMTKQLPAIVQDALLLTQKIRASKSIDTRQKAIRKLRLTLTSMTVKAQRQFARALRASMEG